MGQLRHPRLWGHPRLRQAEPAEEQWGQLRGALRTLGLILNPRHWPSTPQGGQESWGSSLDAATQGLLSLRVRQENLDKQDLPKGEVLILPSNELKPVVN